MLLPRILILRLKYSHVDIFFRNYKYFAIENFLIKTIFLAKQKIKQYFGGLFTFIGFSAHQKTNTHGLL